MPKARVAVLKTRPETVLEDVGRTMELAEVRRHLAPGAATILKDNISWHFPFPGANTTPWQLEGTIQKLRADGYGDLVCVQNNTVVTDPKKGERLNRYLPVLDQYGVPVRYNCFPEDLKWVRYEPKGKMLALPKIYPEGITIPEFFLGKNVVHLPTVKCVAGDAQLVLADGSLVTIRELVARELARAPVVKLESDGTAHAAGSVEILAMAPDGKIRPFTAVAFCRSKRGSRRVLRLRTRTGRVLTASADHRCHTPEGWKALGDLAPGARVAIARRLAIEGRSQRLPATFATPAPRPLVARSGRKYSAAFSQGVLDAYQAGATATALAAQAGVRWQVVQSILRRHDVEPRRNVAAMQVPETTSPEFCRWLGYVLAEGNVEVAVRGSHKLWWVNQESALRGDYVALTRQLFGLKPHERGNGQVYVYSRRLGGFLEEIGLPLPLKAENKRVPPLLFSCPDEEVAAFLSAYIDGDGHVSKKQADVSVTTKSLDLARDVQTLFGRLGVVASRRAILQRLPGWTEARTYHMVTVSGAALLRLADCLRLRHPEKRRRLEQHARRLCGSKQPSNWDTVPIPPALFRRVREGLRLTQQQCGRPASVNTIENSHGQATPRIARDLIARLADHDLERRFAVELDELARLASEDLAWDVVAEIDEIEEDVDLFDITVPGADSFVANGLVVHNCHIYTTTTGAMKNAFGGLLNTRRHYTHSWIHETLVDLLTIQKEIHSGIFAVMDGTTCGNGPGPRTMIPVEKDVLLASGDQVAIDAVAAKMMGFDPLSIPYIRLAHDAGLGCGDPRDIEIVGEDVSRWNFHFSVGDNAVSRFGDLVWFGPLHGLQKLLFRTPLVYLFVFGSYFYHDFAWYPTVGKRRIEKYRRTSKWMRLFEQYPEAVAEEKAA